MHDIWNLNVAYRTPWLSSESEMATEWTIYQIPFDNGLFLCVEHPGMFMIDQTHIGFVIRILSHQITVFIAITKARIVKARMDNLRMIQFDQILTSLIAGSFWLYRPVYA